MPKTYVVVDNPGGLTEDGIGTLALRIEPEKSTQTDIVTETAKTNAISFQNRENNEKSTSIGPLPSFVKDAVHSYCRSDKPLTKDDIVRVDFLRHYDSLPLQILQQLEKETDKESVLNMVKGMEAPAMTITHIFNLLIDKQVVQLVDNDQGDDHHQMLKSLGLSIETNSKAKPMLTSVEFKNKVTDLQQLKDRFSANGRVIAQQFDKQSLLGLCYVLCGGNIAPHLKASVKNSLEFLVNVACLNPSENLTVRLNDLITRRSEARRSRQEPIKPDITIDGSSMHISEAKPSGQEEAKPETIELDQITIDFDTRPSAPPLTPEILRELFGARDGEKHVGSSAPSLVKNVWLGEYTDPGRYRGDSEIVRVGGRRRAGLVEGTIAFALVTVVAAMAPR